MKWRCILFIEIDKVDQISIRSIDAHGLKIQGKGYLMFLPKSLGGGGGSRLSGKIAGGSPYFGFYCILLTSFSKICLGVLFHPPSTLTPPPPCVLLWQEDRRCQIWSWKILVICKFNTKLWKKLTLSKVASSKTIKMTKNMRRSDLPQKVPMALPMSPKACWGGWKC
jgi:hypothetical protein